MRYSMIVLAGLATAMMVGCKDDGVATNERDERTGALFEGALTAEAQGDISAAETLYRQLLQKDPTNASAHLNLAMLLHDQKKNYIEAIHHYEAYLALQPTAEKAPMVKGRIDVARSLLTEQLAGEVINRRSRELDAEFGAIRNDLAQAQAALTKANNALLAKDNEIAELTRKVQRQETVLQGLKDVEAENKRLQAEALETARKTADEAKAREVEESTDALIASVRQDAQMMIEQEDGGQAARNEATRAAVEGMMDEEPIASKPTPGKRYLVRPGDTLSKLAREAYGKESLWTTIQNANRSTTNPDGRLRAGETILIP